MPMANELEASFLALSLEPSREKSHALSFKLRDPHAAIRLPAEP
jgi:hypothetical protein